MNVHTLKIYKKNLCCTLTSLTHSVLCLIANDECINVRKEATKKTSNKEIN